MTSAEASDGRIGPYEIVRCIAQGGMGEVLLARLHRPGGFEKMVAVKRLLPERSGDAAFAMMFEREARLAAALTHRNVVQIFDFGRAGADAWLAMEYVHGVDLKAVLDAQAGAPLPLGLVVEIGRACARGLHHAHRARGPDGRPLGLVHGDVSPHNVLLSFEGDVKLADFGLARAVASGDVAAGPQGKLAYMSPEQARGEPGGPTGDQFGLGVVLYEMCSGARAFFDGAAVGTMLTRLRRGVPLRPLRVVAPDAPDALVEVIERALAPTPSDRYVDAAALEQALTEAAARASIAPGVPALGPWLEARFPGRRAGDLAPQRAALDDRTASAVVPISVASMPESSAPSPSPPLPQSDLTARRPRRGPYFVAAVCVLAAVAWWIRPIEPVESPGAAPAHADSASEDGATAPVVVAPSPDTEPADAGPSDAGSTDAESTDAVWADSGSADALAAPPRPPIATRRRRAPPRRRQMRALTPVAEPESPSAGVASGVAIPTPEPVVTWTAPHAPRPPAAEAIPLPHVRVQAPAARIASRTPRSHGGWMLDDHPVLVSVVSPGGPPVKIRLERRRTRVYANINARPWGQVFVDSRPMGETPAAGLPLPAGERRVRVVGPGGAATEFSVVVAEIDG